jgi:peptidoglycan/LPS O-acetylase OafA/YrhL
MKKEFAGLEILRFLCALTILIWHYQHFFISGPTALLPAFQREAQPFFGLLSVFYNYGNYGVQVFWEISGFIFFWKYGQPIHDGAVTAWRFFVLRFSRLYPLHLLTLLAVAVLQWQYRNQSGAPFVYVYNDVYHFVLNLFFASDWGFHKGLSFNGPIWSISIEVLAYAVFFLAVSRMRVSLGGTAAVLLALVVAKMLLPWIKDMILCMIYFFFGGGIYLLTAKARGIRPWHLAIMAVLTVLLLVANTITEGKVHTITLVVLSTTLVVAAVLAQPLIKGTRLDRMAPFFGNLTYSSYLIHFPLQLGVVLVLDRWQVQRAVFFHPAALLAFLLATLALSHLSYRFFEVAAQDRIRRVFG